MNSSVASHNQSINVDDRRSVLCVQVDQCSLEYRNVIIHVNTKINDNRSDLSGMLGLKAWPRPRGLFLAASASSRWPRLGLVYVASASSGTRPRPRPKAV